MLGMPIAFVVHAYYTSVRAQAIVSRGVGNTVSRAHPVEHLALRLPGSDQ